MEQKPWNKEEEIPHADKNQPDDPAFEAFTEPLCVYLPSSWNDKAKNCRNKWFDIFCHIISINYICPISWLFRENGYVGIYKRSFYTKSTLNNVGFRPQEYPPMANR